MYREINITEPTRITQR